MRIEIAKELRKNAGIVASEKDGKAIRNALSNSLEALSLIIEEEELPIKKMVSAYYLRGILSGVGVALMAFILLMLMPLR